MSDRTDHDISREQPSSLEMEAARMVFAARRVRELSALELQLLEQAVEATDDATSLQLEVDADTAWRDALALSGEHDPNHASPPAGSS